MAIRATEAATGRSLHVLLGEDDETEALGLKMFLREVGHVVVGCVGTAPDAVRAAQVHRPDLVLMDVSLASAADGIDAAFEIWLRWNIPSVLLAEGADRVTLARARRARPLEILTKPVPPQQLRFALVGAGALLDRTGTW